jgi:hypothetical protein
LARKAVSIVIALAVAGVAVYLIMRALESDESRIRRSVARFEKAIEAKNVFAFIDGVDPDYRDVSDFDYETLKGIAFESFKRFESLELDVRGLNVSVEPGGNTATAWFDCRLLAKAASDSEGVDIVGKFIGSPLIVLKFAKRDGRWLVKGAQYGPGTNPPAVEE